MVSSADRKKTTAYLHSTYEISISRACKTIGFPKSVYYYTSIKDDSEVIEKLEGLVQVKPTRGFPYYFNRLRNEGYGWNHKKVKRVYNALGLNIRRKHKRRLPMRIQMPLNVPDNANYSWSMDFMHDTLSNGRKVRILNIIDDYNRQALCVEADYSHSGISVSHALTRLITLHGKPIQIRCDNGPEFISHALADYCQNQHIKLQYIQPGKPTQNAYIERFNRSFREDILDAYLFSTLQELQELSWEWMNDYNQNHPHQSLNYQSPLQYLELNQHI